MAAALAALDAWLRADRRAKPAVAISAALAVLWAAHLILFPGTVPGIDQVYTSVATASVFMAINLMTPLMLSVALLWLGGTMATPGRTAGVALGVGLLLGGLVVATALYLTPSFPIVTAAFRPRRIRPRGGNPAGGRTGGTSGSSCRRHD